MINDRLIQRGHVFRHIFVVQTRDTVQRRSVDDREVQLFVGRVEVNKQVEYLVNNPVRRAPGRSTLLLIIYASALNGIAG
ncbi:hypothetical protein L243_31540 [Salmonella enterica subsp. enterica serovar Worthington str. BCH-3008]|nr:hypothetical protein L243_31540 [Salmonella enterica subsp. enterica serovar Worthington str. BCH-3008]